MGVVNRSTLVNLSASLQGLIKSKKCSNLVLGKGKRQNIHYFGHTVIPEIWAKFSILSICSFKINHLSIDLSHGSGAWHQAVRCSIIIIYFFYA